MSYIYDVLVNYKEKLYDFYDWNVSDDVIHIRKIPLFKVDSKTMFDFKNNKVKVDNNFLIDIKNKTEIFNNKNIKTIEYSFILSDGLEVIAFTFDYNGISNKKSCLLLDEETEVLEVIERIDETSIKYINVSKQNIDKFKTRKELMIQQFIKTEINNIVKDDNIDKLKYLYYECFNKRENDPIKIVSKINNSLKKDWDSFAFKIYDFFKLTKVDR